MMMEMKKTWGWWS